MSTRPGIWYLQNLHLFEKLPFEAEQAVVTAAVLRRFARREVFRWTDGSDRIGAVAKGAAKVYRTGLLGRQIAETVLFEGDLFGCIAGREPSATCQRLEMLEPTTLLLIP